MYPELVIPPDQMQAFLRDRKGCIVRAQAAQTWLARGRRGAAARTIHPGTWDFAIRGIYQGRDTRPTKCSSSHWQYLNESLRRS